MSENLPAHPTSLLGFIERAARDPEFDIQKFGALLQMQREMEEAQERRTQREAERLFYRAVGEVQARAGAVARDRANPHTQSRYATLQAIDAVYRPIYTDLGFSVTFKSEQHEREGWMRMVCVISHEAGHVERHSLDGPMDASGLGGRTTKTGIQAIGSTSSYLRRYLMMQVWNIVVVDDPADDDGEATRQRAAASTMPRPPKITEPASNDDPGGWKDFAHKVHATLSTAMSRKEVLAIGDRKAITQALEDPAAPSWLRRDLDTMFAAAYERFPEQPEDELPDIEITGEARLSAG